MNVIRQQRSYWLMEPAKLAEAIATLIQTTITILASQTTALTIEKFYRLQEPAATALITLTPTQTIPNVLQILVMM